MSCTHIDDVRLISSVTYDLQEAGMMASMRHPNVVMYLGVCLQPPCVVTEYCARGSLNDVFKRARATPALAAQLDWGRRCASHHSQTSCYLVGNCGIEQLVLALQSLPSQHLQARRPHPCHQPTCSEQQVAVVLHSLGRTGLCSITVTCCSEQVNHCVQSLQSLCLQKNMAMLDWLFCTCKMYQHW